MMNKADVLKVMTVLKAAYPNFYRNVGGEEAEGVVNLWMDMFAGDDPVLVMAAVKALIALDEKAFRRISAQSRRVCGNLHSLWK